MFLNKRGQSTAEYAIVIGLVIAVAAGALQVALKGGIRQKNKQALDLLLDAGNTDPNFNSAGNADVSVFSQDYRSTNVLGDAYVDETVLFKGGAEKKHQVQKTESTSVAVELVDEAER